MKERTVASRGVSSRACALRAAGTALLALAMNTASAETVRYRLTAREAVEARLREYGGTNRERGAKLKRMFADAGCEGHLSEQPVRFSQAPNVICVLPGSSDRVILVGAHFDRVLDSDGVADNWSGAALLPSLYEALKVESRLHTYVFIGFTDEEKGLVGSRFHARKMTREQVAATDAMVNLDTLGLAPTGVWTYRSDKRLIRALLSVANHFKLPLNGVNFERVGSTDSESYASRKIPRITIHSLTQKSEDEGILHTRKDKLSVMNLDYYYDTYRLLAVYLAYLDSYLKSAPAPAP